MSENVNVTCYLRVPEDRTAISESMLNESPTSVILLTWMHPERTSI